MLLTRLLLALTVTTLVGCTAVAVDPSDASKIKSVTVIELRVPEYSYTSGGAEGAAKALGLGAAAYGFGAIGVVFGGVAITKMEQPYRDAIRNVLAPHAPSFETTFNTELDAVLKARGISTAWAPPPALLADGSGYDLSAANFDSDYVIELLPLAVGFNFDDSAGYPSVNVRWRLIKRYPGGKFIETNRGYVVYQTRPSALAGISALAQVAPVADYRYPGHVDKLASHGEAPAVALRAIAREAARLTTQRALPVAVQ